MATKNPFKKIWRNSAEVLLTKFYKTESMSDEQVKYILKVSFKIGKIPNLEELNSLAVAENLYNRGK
jgi:hypothetical protein